jgi:hypothetical protein
MYLSIEHDPDPMNPRTEYENLGEILYTSSRYTLGDRRTDASEIEGITEDPTYVSLPVYAYIHGDISLSLGHFNDRFDSGQCGIIYASHESIKKEFNVSEVTYDVIERVQMIFRSEIETFNAYLNGDVYGFVVRDGDDGRILDACWGFYSRDEAESDGLRAITYLEKERAEAQQSAEDQRITDLYTRD